MKKNNFYLQAILAGILIGLGDIVYVFNENHILGAFLFSLGLLSILVKSIPLYTGRIGYLEKFDELWDAEKGMFLMLMLNFIGIGLVCSLANLSHLDLSSVNNIVETKFNQPWYSALFLSWGCGVMMFLAVNGWKLFKNPIYVIMPIMFFILCGFEHCIANFGYFCMWITSDFYNNIHNIPYMFSSNLLIMIIGNALGSLTISKIHV